MDNKALSIIKQIHILNNENITEFTLESDLLIVKIIDLGATITNIIHKSDNMNVVLAYDEYSQYNNNTTYFGATIGRVANRIKNGKFTLNNVVYNLACNDGKNSLHGGAEGFHRKKFFYSIKNDGVVLEYLSPHMEEGYPGELKFKVYFKLIHNELSITYEASSTEDTIVNFTNHSYFSLQGDSNQAIVNQYLKANISHYALIDKNRLSTGELKSVIGTAFDFSESQKICEILEKKKSEQNIFADGYDHFLVFDKDKKKVVELYDEITKHKLTVLTDLPGFHLFVPNYKEPINGHNKTLYRGRCACCIETSLMPNDINFSEKSDMILKKGEKFCSTTTYTFE